MGSAKSQSESGRGSEDGAGILKTAGGMYEFGEG